MMRHRLKITRADLDSIRASVFADLPNEAGAFALAGVSGSEDTRDVLVRRPVLIPKGYYERQQPHRLEISSKATNGIAALCEANGLTAVICHSHPDEYPYSTSDDHGERRMVQVLKSFIPKGCPVASLLFTPGGVRGRIWTQPGAEPIPLSEISILGRSLQRIDFENAQSGVDQSEHHARQVLAFGEEGQKLLSRLRLAVVGVGGTGSAVAEQLARIGVMDIVLIDPDHLSSTNISRVFGSFPESGHVGSSRRSKVDVVSQHLQRINPQSKISTICSSVVERAAALKLLDRDIILLCTDDHWGRSVVNQIAYQYLIPTLNIGVRLSADMGVLTQAIATMDVLRPDLPCLWCKGFLQPDRIAAESIPDDVRRGLQRQGYAADLDSPTPSVISMTSLIASVCVTQVLQFATDFMGDVGEISRLNYDAFGQTIRRGSTNKAEGCSCSRVRGRGDLMPLNVVDACETMVHR